MESDDILNESLICCHLTFFPFPYSSTTLTSSYFSFPCFDFFVYVSSPPYLSINHLTYSPSFFPSFLSSFLPCFLPSFLPSFLPPLLSYLAYPLSYFSSTIPFHLILLHFTLLDCIFFYSALSHSTPFHNRWYKKSFNLDLQTTHDMSGRITHPEESARKIEWIVDQLVRNSY